MKKYVKARVLAKNNPQGSYAAGCPQNRHNGSAECCRNCEMTK